MRSETRSFQTGCDGDQSQRENLCHRRRSGSAHPYLPNTSCPTPEARGPTGQQINPANMIAIKVRQKEQINRAIVAHDPNLTLQRLSLIRTTIINPMRLRIAVFESSAEHAALADGVLCHGCFDVETQLS
jgi:hypothetical protein